jgi:uncharacterized protein (DUF427 family)
MDNTLSKGKEIKIPGPDHPITISPPEGRVRVTVAGRIVAESTRALRLEEKGYSPVYYLPRSDADMSLLVRTTHYLLSVQGRLQLLEHSRRWFPIGELGVDIRESA